MKKIKIRVDGGGSIMVVYPRNICESIRISRRVNWEILGDFIGRTCYVYRSPIAIIKPITQSSLIPPN